MSDSHDLPIGVFDSGLGGLTVLRTLCQHFPYENFLYLGDTARLPYGAKSPQSVEKYLAQNVAYLIKHKIKALVVACNSASSVMHAGTNFGVPTYNVIEPGARAACNTSLEGRIGVIGTRTTVGQMAYVRAIQQIRPEAQVLQQACPLLVPLVEEGWVQDPITNLVIYRYLHPLTLANIDTLILGCTHYPVLRTSIQNVLGSGVELIDSAQAIADNMKKDFNSGLIKPSGSKEAGRLQVLVTDFTAAFAQMAERLMKPFAIHSFESVDLI